MPADVDLTGLLRRAEAGDAGAVEVLFATTYRELRRVARAHLRNGGRSAVLDTTAVVHESYLRFAQASGLRFEDRIHFMGYVSRAMRAVIIDFARRQVAARRGGGARHVSLTQGENAPAGGAEDVLRVHDALEALAALDERMARVVELRYFGGLTESEIALTLNVTERTVRRDWEKARCWLGEALKDG